MPTFEIGEQDFLLDGRPLQIVSGALHYFRVHPDQWADRIRKARLMGLNTIETYVAWNFHSPTKGEFRTAGRYDLGRFLDLVAAEGLHAIVRPGPYICAEWDGGGLPAWLFATPGVGVRRAEPQFLEAIGGYYADVLPILAERQVTRGGPVLAVQVENEYGAYGDDSPEERASYLRALVDLTRAQGIEVPLFTCDQANDEHLARGGLPELLRTATFGSRSAERLATLRRHQPWGPLACMEFWDGWFDSWGLHHHTTPPEANALDLDDLLAAGASVNVYMFHGGTNFGLTNGANDKGTYLPITTSYDYDAPLAEHGVVTPKYLAMRDVISRHRTVPDELPAPAPSAPEAELVLDRRVPLADLLPLLGEPRRTERLPTHDELGQWSGFTLYGTSVMPDDGVVTFADVRDRAWVALDGEPVGVLGRTEHVRTLPLPRRQGELTLLVEDEGRVNYGRRIGEAKGLVGPARTATRELTGWTSVPLAFDGSDGLLDPRVAEAVRGGVLPPPSPRAVRGSAAGRRGDPGTASPSGTVADDAPFAGPVLCLGVLETEPGADHFLRLDGWTRGLVWVNGFPLGRFRAAGPTATLYVPGPVVRERNEVVVLEVQGAAAPVVRFVAGPDLGPTEA
ncbi:glycoside hydrolase family 35 protein [Antribacter gilvus]|uniref:glycoside hydrolase family 35 protein n=1 Tax=Antribacter gilvus TaxID=2304675 RepID=UPI000F78F256|nr:beta-galactosidase family protein [Antribacter gilvus]